MLDEYGILLTNGVIYIAITVIKQNNRACLLFFTENTRCIRCDPLANPCQAVSADTAAAAALACELWAEHSVEEMRKEFASLLEREDAAVFLYREQGEAVGFAQCQLRHDYVEGTETSPVGYLEGIYVRENARRQGIARKLLSACENWAKAQGCTEFASDCELDNTDSQRFHHAVGFEEANRIVAYVKRL